jgi:RNA polymerase sigma-70 factor (ECF subfamily)
MDFLLARHRSRLRRMIAVRIDPRLAGRVDPSDIVQETLLEAARKLPRFASERRLPFYPWLRELACEQLIRLHRHHLQAQRRSVTREENLSLALSEESTAELADFLAAGQSGPSQQAIREEIRHRVREALAQLDPRDREILVMRHLEQLEIAEIAAILQITESAVMMRRFRALERLRQLLPHEQSEDEP